jgi:hypothetical protein
MRRTWPKLARDAAGSLAAAIKKLSEPATAPKGARACARRAPVPEDDAAR